MSSNKAFFHGGYAFKHRTGRVMVNWLLQTQYPTHRHSECLGHHGIESYSFLANNLAQVVLQTFGGIRLPRLQWLKEQGHD